MNMKKIMAGVVASALAVGTMAVAASADTTGYALIGVDWGEPTAEANEVTLSGNWNGAGLALPEDVVEAANGDFSNIILNFTFTVPTMEDDAQAQKDAYGDEESDHVIDDMVVCFIGNGTAYRDGKGLILVADDGNGGYESSYTHSVKASLINTNDDGTFYAQVQNGAVTDVVWTVTYTVEEADEPATEDGGTDEPAPAEDEGTVEPAPAQEDDAPTATEAVEEAPTTTAAETAAPAAGTGNTATTTADKTNADTGVEGVAVVAGLAIVAAGAVIVAKKRK